MKKNKINLEFFSKPKPKILNRMHSSKFSFDRIDLYSNEPCIYISPRTSLIDKILITDCINTKFLFINDKIIDQLNKDTLPKTKRLQLINEIKLLSKNGYVFALIWNSTPSIFGGNEAISKHLAEFLYQTNLDVKFLTFPALYFAYPMWAPTPRRTKIYANQTITLRHKMLNGLTINEITKTFKDSTPASANVYSNKFETNIKTNNRAIGLERILYCCPECENLCTLYSEYSCIKCRHCCSVFEINNDGKILFSKKISNIDNIENYQYEVLTKKDFNINELVRYDSIIQLFTQNCKKSIEIVVILQIYADKLIATNSVTKKQITIMLDEINELQYTFNNTVIIKTKNAKEFRFYGKNNENLLIIRDLVKINKN